MSKENTEIVIPFPKEITIQQCLVLSLLDEIEWKTAAQIREALKPYEINMVRETMYLFLQRIKKYLEVDTAEEPYKYRLSPAGKEILISTAKFYLQMIDRVGFLREPQEEK